MTATNTYERETLTALYKVFDYANCNDLATDDVVAMILKIETKLHEAIA